MDESQIGHSPELGSRALWISCGSPEIPDRIAKIDISPLWAKPAAKAAASTPRCPSGAISLICFLLIIFFAGVVSASDDDFWVKEDYRKWSREECRQLLENSPWSKYMLLNTVVVLGYGVSSTRGTGSETSPYNDNNKFNLPEGVRGSQPYIKYIAQLRSAQPIRRAIIRQAQFDQNYEKLSPKQKEDFDKSAEQYLSTNVAEIVILTVTYTTNYGPYDLELSHHWQSQTTDSLKNSVYLFDSNGNKIGIKSYIPTVRGFQLMFPRQNEGQPVLDAQEKSMKFEFPYPTIGNMGDGRAFFEFPADKMLIQETIVY